MSKSIFDTRFTSKKMALDAACKDALIALDEWITMHGAHVHINEEGVIDAGAGGQFNGSRPSEVYKEARELEKNKQVDERRRKLGTPNELKEKFAKSDPAEMSNEQLEKEIEDTRKNVREAEDLRIQSESLDEGSPDRIVRESQEVLSDRLTDLKDEQRARDVKEQLDQYRNRRMGRMTDEQIEKHITDLRKEARSAKSSRGPREQKAFKNDLAAWKAELNKRKSS